MYILKYVIPLVVISLLFGFVIARVDFASFMASSGEGEQQAAVTASDEGGQDWSVDAFVDNLRKRQGAVSVDTPVGKDVAAQLSEAANRAETGSTRDPYLSSILEEASELSVTAVPSAKEVLIWNRLPGSGAGTVTVAEGESLTDIAVRVYGDPLAYQRIFEANRDLLSNPDQIFVGQTLRIPD